MEGEGQNMQSPRTSRWQATNGMVLQRHSYPRAPLCIQDRPLVLGQHWVPVLHVSQGWSHPWSSIPLGSTPQTSKAQSFMG